MDNNFTTPTTSTHERPTMGFSEIFNASYENYKKVIGWQIGLLLMMIVLSYASSFIAQLISGYDTVATQEYIMKNAGRMDPFTAVVDAPGYTTFLGISMLFSLLLQPLYVASAYLMHKGKTEQTITFSDMFIGYKNILSYIILGIMTWIISLVALMLCIFPIFLVLPLVYTAFCFVLFEKQSPFEALKSSFNLAKENYGTVLGVSVAALFVSLAGVLLCGIGIIATGMFFYATAYTVYIAKRGIPVMK